MRSRLAPGPVPGACGARSGDVGHQVEPVGARGVARRLAVPTRVPSERARHGAGLADVPGQAPGVDAGHRRDAVTTEEGLQALGRAPVGGSSARSHTTTPRQCGAGLVVGGVGPVVADVGAGEGDHLPRVGRVRDHLLVAAHGGVEDQLAGRHRHAAPAASPWKTSRPRSRAARAGVAAAGQLRSPLGHRVDHDRFAPQHRVADRAGEACDRRRRVAAAAGQRSRVHHGLGGRVEDAEVGCRPPRRGRPGAVAARRRCVAVSSAMATGCALSSAKIRAGPRRGDSTSQAMGSAVSSPSMPGGACRTGGPSTRARAARDRWRSRRWCRRTTRRSRRHVSSVRRGGLTLKTGSYLATGHR